MKIETRVTKKKRVSIRLSYEELVKAIVQWMNKTDQEEGDKSAEHASSSFLSQLDTGMLSVFLENPYENSASSRRVYLKPFRDEIVMDCTLEPTETTEVQRIDEKHGFLEDLKTMSGSSPDVQEICHLLESYGFCDITESESQ